MVVGDVVHADGDAQHGAERDEVGADVAVADGPVVGAPTVHHAVNVFETVSCRVKARHEPGGRPGRVGAHIEHLVNFGIDVNGPAFRELEHGAEALHEVEAHHRDGHSAAGEEVTGEAAAAEIVPVGVH